MTQGLEVEARTKADIELAILEGFKVFRQLVRNNGGFVDFDADARTLMYRDASARAAWALEKDYCHFVAYTRSEPLKRWLGPRREIIDVLATGHAAVGGQTGPGRPLDLSKPLAHAYVIVALSQFQGFVRDMHDLTVERLISASGAAPTYAPLLTEAMVNGRYVDRGNATHRNNKTDFSRVGVSPFSLSTYNPRWTTPGDSEEFDRLLALRNALGHGNDVELDRLLVTGTIQDTVTWARGRLPVLNRYAKSLDHLLWDHLKASTGKGPW